MCSFALRYLEYAAEGRCSAMAVCVQRKNQVLRNVNRCGRHGKPYGGSSKNEQWNYRMIQLCPISGSVSKEMTTGYRRNICALLVTAASFTRVETQKRYARLSADAWVRNAARNARRKPLPGSALRKGPSSEMPTFFKIKN